MEREQARIIPWVFHKEGSKIGDYRKAWKNACDAAHLPGKLFHALRRTAVGNLERADVPRSVAMKLTGHKVDSVSRRSAIVPERAISAKVSQSLLSPASRENTETARGSPEARGPQHGDLGSFPQKSHCRPSRPSLFCREGGKWCARRELNPGPMD